MNSQHIVVHNGETGTPLQDFLARKMNISRRKAKSLIDSRNVFVNRTRIWMARHKLEGGDIVEFPQTLLTTSSPRAMTHEKAQILYQDQEFLIVNKKTGILANGPNSMETMVQEQLALPSAVAAHRLDRDTTGCFMMAKTQAALDAITPLFAGREITKVYHAIVRGLFSPREQTISHPIDGEPAVTKFRAVDANREASHIQARIETGRTHQIRKHLVATHHPIIGDKQYGVSREADDRSLTIQRQMLHAFALEFTNPISNAHIRVTAPLPADFRHCLRLFRLT